VATPSTDSTAMVDGKPTRSAGPPAARAPQAARQQGRYDGQRYTGRHRKCQPRPAPGKRFPAAGGGDGAGADLD